MSATALIKPMQPAAFVRGNSILKVSLFALTAVLITLPLAVIDVPLLADYPNHVARTHIINNLNDKIFIASRYSLGDIFLPNVAIDHLVPLLARVMPFDLASRLFLAFCLISSLAGVVYLHWTLFGKWSCYPLIGAMFAHHASLLAGMVNFSLGIGLVPAALAIWIRWSAASAYRRLIVGCLIAFFLYFCHLVAFAAYGLLILGFECVRAYETRRHASFTISISHLAIAGATGLAPTALFVSLLASGETDPAGEIVYGNLAWKLKALLAPLSNYHLPLDLFSFFFLTGLALIAWRAGWLDFERRMVPGLVLLTVAFLLAPKALGAGGVFDQRFTVLLAPMLIACSRFQSPGGLAQRVLPLFLAGLLLVRLAVLTTVWIEHRDDLAEMRAMSDLIQPGGRVLVVRPDEGAGLRLAPPRHLVFHHAAQLQSLPTLAVVDKNAFVSTLYAIPGQHPLHLKPPFDRLGGRGHENLPTLNGLRNALRPSPDRPMPTPQIRSWIEDFDYVLMIYGYGPMEEGLTRGLPLIQLRDGAIMDLFRIDKD